MPINTFPSPDQKEIIIKVSGRFEYSLVQEFRNAYKDREPDTHFIVDLANTTYLDSSALGMLIHLWKFANQDKSRVKIINCNPAIRKILDITHFERNFIIE